MPGPRRWLPVRFRDGGLRAAIARGGRPAVDTLLREACGQRRPSVARGMTACDGRLRDSAGRGSIAGEPRPVRPRCSPKVAASGRHASPPTTACYSGPGSVCCGHLRPNAAATHPPPTAGGPPSLPLRRHRSPPRAAAGRYRVPRPPRATASGGSPSLPPDAATAHHRGPRLAGTVCRGHRPPPPAVAHRLNTARRGWPAPHAAATTRYRTLRPLTTA